MYLSQSLIIVLSQISSSFAADGSLPVGHHTVSYTYEDDPLPTIVALGTPPLEKGLPAPTFDIDDMPCVLDPSSTSSQFNILGSNFFPLVIHEGNKLLPLAAPTEAEAIAMGHPNDYLPPVFFFQKPANAPEDVYDIVLAGSTLQYVAMTSQGDAVLTNSSIGNTPVQRDGQFMATSIFGVDCIGRISVTQDGSPYTWDISEDGLSTTFTPGIASSKKTMVAYSLQRQARMKLQRRNQYTEGKAPRCPKEPPDLVAKVFPGARGLEPNGCGPKHGIDFVPDLSFKACCNAHDNCYDDCENGTFETCNKKFHDCMTGPGCDHLKGAWLLHFACLKMADFYAWAVGTKFGRKAFRTANEERCGCYCSEARGLCGRADGDYHCAAIKGPQADVKNCGACGQVCSEKSKWQVKVKLTLALRRVMLTWCFSDTGGNCVCPHDQCGDRCVDLRMHPNNCGACGYKCDSGYCVEGRCHAPDGLAQDRCYPVQGFANGGFSNGSKGWRTCARGCGVSDGGYLDLDDAHAYFEVNGTNEASIATTVQMCPGAAYEISFAMRRWAGNSTCDFKYTFGETVVGETTTLGESTLGEKDVSHRLDFPDPGDLVKHLVGPFNVRAFKKGDNGTTPNGDYLEVDFAGVVTCTDSSALVALDDFELVPVQTEWNKVGQDGPSGV
ncbi:hypothetical protein Hte_008841 [Hypoxylon texense]